MQTRAGTQLGSPPAHGGVRLSPPAARRDAALRAARVPLRSASRDAGRSASSTVTASGAVFSTVWWPATSTAAFGKVASRGFAAGAGPRSSWSRSPARGAGCALLRSQAGGGGAAFLQDEVVQEVGHAQWVFTVPKMLRVYFLHHREFLVALVAGRLRDRNSREPSSLPGKAARGHGGGSSPCPRRSGPPTQPRAEGPSPPRPPP